MTKPKQVKVGDVFVTNEGGSVSVVEYHGSREVLIKHNDKYGHVATVRSDHLRSGQVKNPYHPSVYGVGFFGVGEHISYQKEDSKLTPSYIAWRGMLQRCYCPKSHAEKPTYIGCEVHTDWRNFQTFAKWFDQQYRGDGWQLDKDLIADGNRVYSADTCVFIPHQLNSLVTDCRAVRGDLPQGVSRLYNKYQANLRVDGKQYFLGSYVTPEEAFEIYKFAKEANVRRMAEKYRGLIDPRVYKTLMNYEVTV